MVLSCTAIGYAAYRHEYKHRAVELSLNQTIRVLTDENKLLSNTLEAQREQVDRYQEEIARLSGTLSEYEKLKILDPELLQKYSRVYFLNEHYVPSSLTPVPSQWIFIPKQKIQVHSGIWSHLKTMLEDASKNGNRLLITSGYRSFAKQETLKDAYIITYGTTVANQFTADQGYSEHQLGTTIDVTSGTAPVVMDDFYKSPQYKWLLQNAYKYGFVISFTENNQYYTFEPWHWRYVGVALATKLYTDYKNLYDLEQREINTYLGRIFE